MARRTSDLNVHLNPKVRGLGLSATVAINERSDHLRAEGRRITKLGLGQSPFPVPAAVVKALRANAFQKDYLPVKGLASLREAVADYHRRSQGLSASAEDILIGPGSKELMFLLQLVYCGDVLVPTPAWVSYVPQARILGRKVRLLPTRQEQGWQLMPEDLESLCASDPARPRILILNYPSNPTGCSYTLDTLRELAQVAERYRVILLSDEIYGDLHHQGRHVSIARFYPEGTLVSGGLSKWCGAGSWRLGAFCFPAGLRWLLEAMAAVASETYTSTSAPIQYAAVEAFHGGPEIEDYLACSRRVLSGLGCWCCDRLGDAGVKVQRPAGAFYLFPDFSPLRRRLAERGIKSDREFCERLLEDTGVAILPGSDFGRPPTELTARLAYVDFDGSKALRACAALTREAAIDGSFLRKHCAGVCAGIDQLCDWLS